MTKAHTDYEVFERSSVEHRRLLREEELILDVTEVLSEMLEKEGVKQTELAERLGKTKGFVSQILAGGRNLTLRTIADVADALGYRVRLVFFKDAKSKPKTAPAEITVSGTTMPAATWHWPYAPEWKAQALTETEELRPEIGIAA